MRIKEAIYLVCRASAHFRRLSLDRQGEIVCAIQEFLALAAIVAAFLFVWILIAR